MLPFLQDFLRVCYRIGNGINSVAGCTAIVSLNSDGTSFCAG